ncbi:MAG: hypothetical protein AAF235_10285, partial [Planctomycetota bacterium]
AADAARTVTPGEYNTVSELLSLALGLAVLDTGGVIVTIEQSEAEASPYAEYVRPDGERVRNATGLPRTDPAYTPYAELVAPQIDTPLTVLDPADPLGMATIPNPALRTELRLDRGHLRIDAYEPFVNYNLLLIRRAPNNETFDPTGLPLLSPQPVFQPEFGDFRVGAGAPLAMGLLSNGRVFGVSRDATGTIRRVAETGDRSLLADRVNSPQLGVVNINTASLPVLRTLPGLTPPMFPSYSSTPNISPNFHDHWPQRWELRDLAANVNDTAGDPRGRAIDEDDFFTIYGVESAVFPEFAADIERTSLFRANPDRAAMVAAYRDRSHAEFRMPSRSFDYGNADLRLLSYGDFSPMQLDGAQPIERIRLLARNGNTALGNFSGIEQLTADAENLFDWGRSLVSGMAAPRPQPGFETFGELAGATVARDGDPLDTELPAYVEFAVNSVPADTERWDFGDDSSANPDTPIVDLLNPHSVTGQGYDVNGAIGGAQTPVAIDARSPLNGSTATDDVMQTLEPTPIRDSADPASLTSDGIANDYDEQLAVLGQLAQVVDVRSDMYAAWFKVRGYTREDVEGLGADQPMLPTVERRFLMVIDRSGVVNAGDEPRVLLFRELPE